MHLLTAINYNKHDFYIVGYIAKLAWFGVQKLHTGMADINLTSYSYYLFSGLQNRKLFLKYKVHAPA